MAEELSRQSLIELLIRLGSDADEDVLKAGREIHGQVSSAELDWDDLLVPEGGYDDDDEWEDDEDDDLEDETDDVADETDGPEDETDEKNDDDHEDDDEEVGDAGDDEDDEDDEPKVDDDDDLAELSADDKQEALGLIDKLMARDVSAATKEELQDYKSDIEEDEFGQMDLRYLRAMSQRLGKDG